MAVGGGVWRGGRWGDEREVGEERNDVVLSSGLFAHGQSKNEGRGRGDSRVCLVGRREAPRVG